MPKVSPNQGAEKWARRTKAATEDVRAGVARVTEPPTQKAIAKLEKALRNFEEAVRSGKIERGLARVTLAEWQRSMTDIGIGRIASGVDNKGQSKMEGFAREFYPYVERVQAEIEAMPDTTLEDNIGRMTHNVRRLAEFKRSGS
jgi:hypothetical protein